METSVPYIKDEYLIEKSKIIQQEAKNVKDDIDYIINNYKVKSKKSSIIAKENHYILKFFICLYFFSVFLFWYQQTFTIKHDYVVNDDYVEKKNKLKLFIHLLKDVLISKYLILASIGHTMISIIIFQTDHINKLQNIIKILIP